MKLKEIHKRTTTELIGLVGAKKQGWALAVIELNKRGIHIEWDEDAESVRLSIPNSPLKTLQFWWSRLFD